MLQELAANQLWIAEMPAQVMGFEYGARMTVVLLPDGGLFIHSPIELSHALKVELEEWGPVRFVVAPSRMHYAHVGEFARAYSEAKIYAAPGLRDRLKGIQVDGVLGDTPEPEWADVLDQTQFRGSSLYDEVDFFHRPSRTLILTDLLFNIPTNLSWSTRLVAKSLGILGRPSASRTFRLTMRDRGATRASLQRILAWDFDRILLSHGDIVESGGKEVFRRVFAWLLE